MKTIQFYRLNCYFTSSPERSLAEQVPSFDNPRLIAEMLINYTGNRYLILIAAEVDILAIGIIKDMEQRALLFRFILPYWNIDPLFRANFNARPGIID